MKGIVATPILDRKDKIGFENDEAKWLSNKTIQNWIGSIIKTGAERCSAIDGEILKEEWKKYCRGKQGLTKRIISTAIFLRWLELNQRSL
jgi:hypothetical protein